VRTPGGRVEYEGDARIDGVPGTAAPVMLGFRDVGGAKTGAVLPTGNPYDTIEGVNVTCMDVAMPVVIARAADLGKSGCESATDLTADADFMARVERIRRAAGSLMGMGDVADSVIPKFAIVAPPARGGSITSRYFTPLACHPTHAVTGAICVATCGAMRGTVADGLAVLERQARERVLVEHPSGSLEIELDVTGHDPDLTVKRAAILRTARRLFAGETFVPSAVWAPAAH
jgi:2-methylaconitate cis-trans-isomerase PrpF